MNPLQQAVATSMDSVEVAGNSSFCTRPAISKEELPCPAKAQQLSSNIGKKSPSDGDEKPKQKTRLRTKSRSSYLAKDVTIIPTRAETEEDKSSQVPRAARLALQALGDPDEPILVMDLGQVSRKLHEWRSHLPRVRPHYAVKCNPDKKMVQLLKDGQCGFDCATLAEISAVLKIGGNPEDIIFAHPCKPRSHIRFAKEHGVKHMTFDNAAELQKIANEFPDAKLLLRLVCEDAHAKCPMSMKFGAREEDWEPLLARAASLNLHVVGVSFHVGSGCTEPGAFQKASSDARKVFDIAKEKGFAMDILDIGGGFPGVDTPEIRFRDLAQGISEDLSRLFPEADWPQLRIIAEPGRFFAHSAAALLTKVIAKAQVTDGTVKDDGDEPKFRYYLNDGLYGSFNCLIFDHAEVFPELLDADWQKRPDRRCCIFGPTCDGFDMIVKETTLPELDEGDWVLWRDMGAYTSAAASKFNGFPDAKVWYYAEHGSLPAV
mmetsp:Transcript_44385/g.78010  ORF Transcript_44385/g.78010 Transcript_44385/m.78010 type:complete len:489 (+) Transcript_44385:263-1729(+)